MRLRDSGCDYARLCARWIDEVIIYTMTIALFVLVAIYFGEKALDHVKAFNEFKFVIVYISCILFYKSAFEGSSLQATPGKIAVGIKVAKINGNEISPIRALVRNVSKAISYLVFGGGFFMAAISQKRCLHDIIAGCIVMRKRG